MVLISFTNIVVDEFSYGKRHPMKRYIYFLTHMHSDHYQGISAGWNYGPIYCSQVTKNLLLNKFPLLPDVRVLEMNSPNKICLHAENKIEIVAYAFDANHCPGSVMYMFEGYFGRILHTGDMRFNENLILNNPILYPPNLRNNKMEKVSIQIDECIFDNTYCDPIFTFPKRERACEMLVEIIEKHKSIPNVRFLICVDSVGKEELLVFLSQRFETLIVVNEQRYQSILCMDIPHQLFTTERDAGWIEVIRKGEKQERLTSKNDHCISITCTGWANITGYITKDNRDYLLPYSLHSNFAELELFIRSIYPSVLNTVVRNTAKGEKINNITQFSAYMITLMNLKQRGVEFFHKNYVDFSTVSKSYASLMTNSDNIKKINCALGLELTEQDKLAEDSIDFQNKYSQIFQNKQRFRKDGSGNSKRGAKLSDPAENSSLSLEQFLEIKQSVEEFKEKKRQSQDSLSNTDSCNYQTDFVQKKRSDFYDPKQDKLSQQQDQQYRSESDKEQSVQQEESQKSFLYKKPRIIVRRQQIENKEQIQNEQEEQSEQKTSNNDGSATTTENKIQEHNNPEDQKCLKDKLKMIDKDESSQMTSISDFSQQTNSNQSQTNSFIQFPKKKQIKIQISKKKSYDEIQDHNTNDDVIAESEKYKNKQEMCTQVQQESKETQIKQKTESDSHTFDIESCMVGKKKVSIFKSEGMNAILSQFLSKK